MKNYQVDMNVTVGYSVLVEANNTEDAKLMAEMVAADKFWQGLGMKIEHLGVKEEE